MSIMEGIRRTEFAPRLAVAWVRRALDFVELGKPRLMLMVLVTAGAGFYLGATSWDVFPRLWPTLLGTALAATGALALNQYMERDLDARMPRTLSRPLPEGRVTPGEALLYGSMMSLMGLGYLWVSVSPLVAIVTGVTSVTYLLAYTPLKPLTSLSTIIGAVPGALPPVAGWAAATGEIPFEAGVLFAIVFLWQLPHSLAIAHLYREDYAAAGICVLPVLDTTSRTTARQIVLHTVALSLVALLPWLIGISGPWYALVAVTSGAAFCAVAIAFALHPERRSASRLLLFASLVYLPLIFAAMAWDRRLPLV